MCFPIQFLKLIHIVAAITLIIFGTTLIISGIVTYERNHDLASSDSFYLTIIIAGIVSIVLSILGLLGSKRQDRCLIGTFHCCLILLAFIFFLITITLLIIGTLFKSINQENSSFLCHFTTLEQDINLNYIVQSAEQQFCSESCTCYIQNPSAWSSGALNNYSYTTNDQSPDNILSFQQCQDYNFSDYEKQVQYLANLETRHECAGWCEVSNIYLFTNVNRGPPTSGSCFLTYSTQVGSKILAFSYFILAITFFMTTEIIMICCYQFHPERKPEYQRLYKIIQYFEEK